MTEIGHIVNKKNRKTRSTQKTRPIAKGVAQGSVLDPPILYTNDIIVISVLQGYSEPFFEMPMTRLPSFHIKMLKN